MPAALPTESGDSGNTEITGQAEVDTWDSTFHEYATEWGPGYITFLVDGKPYVSMNESSTSRTGDYHPFFPPHAMYLQLNTAIGGPVRARARGRVHRG